MISPPLSFLSSPSLFSIIIYSFMLTLPNFQDLEMIKLQALIWRVSSMQQAGYGPLHPTCLNIALITLSVFSSGAWNAYSAICSSLSSSFTVHMNIKILVWKGKEVLYLPLPLPPSLSLCVSVSVMSRAQKNECLTICFSSYINHRASGDAPWQIS